MIPDRILLVEAFVSEEAHRLHEDTDRMRDLWAVMPNLLAQTSFDVVASDDVVHSEGTFDD